MQKLIDFSIKTEPDIRYQNLLEPKRQKGGSATLVYSRQYKLTDKTLQQKDYMQKLINFSIRTEPDIWQLNDTGAESPKKGWLQLRNTGLQPRINLTDKPLHQKYYMPFDELFNQNRTGYQVAAEGAAPATLYWLRTANFDSNI